MDRNPFHNLQALRRLLFFVQRGYIPARQNSNIRKLPVREATLKDIPAINEILNAASVVGGASMGTYAWMDAGEVLKSGGVVLTNDTGGFLLLPVSPKEYEAHMFFLPEGRGRSSISAAREGLEIMFRKGAKRILARIPMYDRASRILTRMMGFKATGKGYSDYGVGGTHITEFFECLPS